jgi:hypothetical protein
MDSNEKGMYAEYLFSCECISRGIHPSKPMLDSSVYDIIVEGGGKLYKVQVKYSSKIPTDRNSIQVALCNGIKSKYTNEFIDLFAVYSEHFKGFFIIKNTGSMQGIRLNSDKNSKYGYNFNNFDVDGIFRSKS